MNSRILTKTYFKLLPMQMIVIAMSSINSIVDSMIASRLIGPIALAVCGLTIPCIRIVDSINDILTGGSQILCGRSLGANLLKKTRGIFSLDLLLVAILSTLMALVLFVILPPYWGRWMGVDAEMCQGYIEYTRGFLWGVLPLMLNAQFGGFLQLEHQEKRAYVAMGATLVTNVALDILFIQKLGLGMYGLGLATSVANWAACIAFSSWFFTKKALIRFSFKDIDFKDLKEVTKIGLPGALTHGYQVVRSTITNLLIVRFVGPLGVSAFAATDAFGCIYYAGMGANGSATRLLTSVYYGEKDDTGLVEIMRIAMKKGLALVTGITIVLSALYYPCTRAFFSVADGEVYNMTKWGFILSPFMIPFSTFYLIYQNYCQCLGRMKSVYILSAFDGFIGFVISASILTPLLGMMGIWLSLIVNGIIVLIIILVIATIQNRHFPRSIRELVFAPKFEDIHHYDFRVESNEEVVNCSQKIIDFCQECGVDKRRSMYIGLCAEELTGNVVDHGFTPKKKHSIDVRLMVDEKDVLLRVKDDCRSFNPKEASELFVMNDEGKNLGLHMVSKLVKEMNYQNLFGLNVLMIRI